MLSETIQKAAICKTLILSVFELALFLELPQVGMSPSSKSMRITVAGCYRTDALQGLHVIQPTVLKELKLKSPNHLIFLDLPTHSRRRDTALFTPIPVFQVSILSMHCLHNRFVRFICNVMKTQ